jgi:hypothetical protein
VTVPDYYCGLDLGQAADFTALAIAERTEGPDPANPNRRVPLFAVRHLQRWARGTAYPEIVEAVRTLAGVPPLPGCTLVVDATGVGRAVVDLFRAARPALPCRLRAVTITAGQHAAAGAAGETAPKKDLVACLQVLLQSRRLAIAKELPDAAVLRKELQHFKVKVTTAGNETFEAWRERDHDDLVLAVALACWAGGKPRSTARPFAANGCPEISRAAAAAHYPR